MRELIVRTSTALEIAVVEDGKLVECLSEEKTAESGAIILGRVARLIRGMQAAFIEIGEEKCGFLPLEEADMQPLKANVGDPVLVQVRREAQGTKGAFLSRNISLVGSYVILMPFSDMVGVSGKVHDPELRNALKKVAADLQPGHCGMVMRTASADAVESEIAQEVHELWTSWEHIQQMSKTHRAPFNLKMTGNILDHLITDLRPTGIDQIITDSDEIRSQYAEVCPCTVVHEDPFHLNQIDTQLKKALQRKVWMKSGANLVFDVCEAMTVIDVNTAKFTGSRHKAEYTVLKTNLEACEEIARQIRLRALGGIILIDMIDMNSDEERDLVLKRLRETTGTDRIKTVVHGFTSLGLLELTRKRTGKNLYEVYGEPCHVCHGQGYLIKGEKQHERNSSHSFAGTDE